MQERIQELQWEYLPYSPDLAPSDFHLFGLLKHHLGGKRFTDDKDVEKDVWKWVRQQSKKTYMLPVLTQW
jgi:histone-lysine N-methyltransferase SETMAR